MRQQRIEVEPAPDPPDLPAAPEYWPMLTSSYATYRVQGRSHCTVCVKMIHSGRWVGGVPRAAHWVRRRVKGARLSDEENSLLLCHFHRRQYLNRDNEARVKAGMDPLPGGG